MSDQSFWDKPKDAEAGPGRIGTPQPSGLPQSALGGLHPELRARITAARAKVDDFKRETDAFIDGSGERPLFEDHAWRLYTELRLILASIEDIK